MEQVKTEAEMFRLYSGQATKHGWETYKPIGTKSISTIFDRDGLSRPITSIPSPFARMDLVLTAFKHISEQCTGTGDLSLLDGDTQYHKLVSDSFDIATLFMLQADAEFWKKHRMAVHKWSPKTAVDRMRSKDSESIKRLAATLELYVAQDGNTLGLDFTEEFHIMEVQGKVVGATSPATLFFASGNDLSWVNVRVGTDVLLDNEYRPLYKRFANQSDLLRMYADYLGRHPNSKKESHPMYHLRKYLEHTCDRLSGNDGSDLKALMDGKGSDKDDQSYSNLCLSQAGNEGNDAIRVGGVALRMKAVSKSGIADASHFVIQTGREMNDPPLVLTSDLGDPTFQYVGSEKWDPKWKVDRPQEADLSKRYLPHQAGVKYPYLTAWDFFEDRLVKLVYPVDKEHFFNGNVSGNSSTHGYLLPLRKKVLEFFSAEALANRTIAGKPMFELIEQPGGVTAKLRVPVGKKDSGRCVVLQRTYQAHTSIGPASVDLDKNLGAIIELEVGLAINPFLKLPVKQGADTADPNMYKVLFIDQIQSREFADHDPPFLDFVKNGGTLAKVDRLKSGTKLPYPFVKKDRKNAGAWIYSVAEGFDAIQFTFPGQVSNMIIPKLPMKDQGGKRYKFAIDFGTTYTHVEYMIEGESGTQPFSITSSDEQYQTLHHRDDRTVLAVDISYYPDFLFSPRRIGRKERHFFPQRSVLLQSVVTDRGGTDSTPDAFDGAGIPYVYSTDPLQRFGQVLEGIKWGDSKPMQQFLYTLLYKIRNKVILGDGSFHDTKIVWLYPTSMSEARRNSLSRSLTAAIDKLLPGAELLPPIPESIAPAIYLKEGKREVRGGDHAPVVGIDIGGGTVDIVIIGSEGRPKGITSARFGGNFVIGDGFVREGKGMERAGANGFVIRYLPRVQGLLKESGSDVLLDALNEIVARGRANEIMGFLFSLADNVDLKTHHVSIDVSKELSEDPELKVVLLYYFSLVFHHLAVWMHANGQPSPSNIVLSGNGARLAPILDNHGNLKNLGKLSTEFFREVYGNEELNDVGVFLADEPKVLTAKGALIAEHVSDDTLEKILSTHVGGAKNGLGQIKVTDLESSSTRNELFNDVLVGCKAGLDIIDKVNAKLDFNKRFGVSSKNVTHMRSEIEKHMADSLNEGLAMLLHDAKTSDREQLHETLYFFPFVEGLGAYANDVVRQ